MHLQSPRRWTVNGRQADNDVEAPPSHEDREVEMFDERTTAWHLPVLPGHTSEQGLEEPAVLVLYRLVEDGTGAVTGEVVAWVLVLPGGRAVLVPAGPGILHPVVTTLAIVRRRWARSLDAELGQVQSQKIVPLAV
jgi:hypothetical protein